MKTAHTVPDEAWTVIAGTGLEVFQVSGQVQTVIVIAGGVILPRGPVWAVRVAVR